MKAEYFMSTPEGYDGYTFGIEKIETILEEVKVLHNAHWEETEKLYLNYSINPDYERYIELEQLARFVLFTCRNNETGLLVGDLMYYLASSMHIKGVPQATEDAFFLLKEARNGLVAYKYLQYAGKALEDLGVKLIGMSDKSPCGGKSLAGLMKKAGYRPVSINYVKEVGD